MVLPHTAREIWKQLKQAGNLATTQNYPYVTNEGEAEINMRVYKVDSLNTSIGKLSFK